MRLRIMSSPDCTERWRCGISLLFFGERREQVGVRFYAVERLQNRAHGITIGAAQKRAAGSFADNQRLDAEGDAIAHERAEIFRACQRVHGDKQQGFGFFDKMSSSEAGRGIFPTARCP